MTAQAERPRSIIAGAESAVADVAAAAQGAEAAFATYRATSLEQRAAFLDAVAAEIEHDRDVIVAAAVAESGLPEGRIAGELGRTTGQLRLFAGAVRQGDHLGVRVDPALPDRKPMPRPDLRQRMVPLGPVAVFGASNFPLAFSTAGGDTASALAAGCPVVVKGHPAHPRTGMLVAVAVARAVAAQELPAGTFSFLLGPGIELGQELVADARIRAVGFTGSRRGGLALAATAAARPEPIPVYAEMSSINPVVVLSGALQDGDIDALAAAYVGSLTLGAGQFCTNPGMLFLPAGEAGDAFLTAARDAVAQTTGQPMLTSDIADAYVRDSAALREVSGVRVVAEGTDGVEQAPRPLLVEAKSSDGVTDEVFGACGVVVRYDDVDKLAQQVRELEGQLTATVHCGAGDTDAARTLLPALEDRVGRILFNGWPTGVEVSHAMVHGGPFPATTDGRTTSVGTLAIERFQRPVCYQDVPDEVLPEVLRSNNPWGLRRRIDGDLEQP